jgi:hypothetical protein
MRWLAAFGLLVGSAASSVTLAADPKVVPGEWTSYTDSQPFKLGIVSGPGDVHAYFFSAACSTVWVGGNREKPVADITLEPDHRVVSQAVASESYLVARFEADGESYDLWAKSIHFNEGPSFSVWAPEFTAHEPEKLVQILLGKQVILHFGLRTGDGKVTLNEAYRLPDENRITAVDFFAGACFPDLAKSAR